MDEALKASLSPELLKQWLSSGDDVMPRWTEYDLNAFESRKLGKATAHTEARGCENERELHEQIRQECLRRGWLAFHGSMAHATFRTEGEPDYVILCNGGKVLLVECKTRTGKLSPAQLAVKAWASRLSHEVYTVRSIEEFHRIANQVTKPPHAIPRDDGIQTVRHVRD